MEIDLLKSLVLESFSFQIKADDYSALYMEGVLYRSLVVNEFYFSIKELVIDVCGLSGSESYEYEKIGKVIGSVTLPAIASVNDAQDYERIFDIQFDYCGRRETIHVPFSLYFSLLKFLLGVMEVNEENSGRG